MTNKINFINLKINIVLKNKISQIICVVAKYQQNYR